MKERKYGIDLLRMILMLMVVVLHVLGKGGVLNATQIRTANYYTAWLLEISCYCAVNCYALITGYVYYHSKYRISSMLLIGIQALFYSTIIYILSWIISPASFSRGLVLNALFPVARETHWYLSSYAGLFLLIPALNAAIDAFSLRQTKYFLLLSFIGFSLAPTFLMHDPFKLNNGYSTLWLVYMYLIGGFVHKFHFDAFISKKKAFLFFAVCIAMTAIFKFTVEEITIFIFGNEKFSKLLIRYVSPTILFAGLSLFLVFLHINPKPALCRFIGILSPAAFGVYLIHCHPVIFELFEDRFTFLNDLHQLFMPLGVLAVALGIYLPCLMIDYLRLKIFQKLSVKAFLNRLENKFLSEDFTKK